jgi:class 3 adenylate cyclase/pimeloyl-ACP methyl ester carboxylesterase
MIGPVQWARSGDANIAYRIVGDGPVDLVFLGGVISHVEVMLDEPGIRRWFERLGTIARTILVDRRGAGLSDAMPDDWSAKMEAEDLLAVLDTAGMERVVLYSYAAATPSALQFAADHPDRTLAMILYAPVISQMQTGTGSLPNTPEEFERRSAEMMNNWGDGTSLGDMAPSAARMPRIQDWLGRMERLSMTPAGLQRLLDNLRGNDARDILPRVSAPTRVLYRAGDSFIDLEQAHYVAEHLPDAELVELPGDDSLPMIGETEPMLSEIEEFLTGKRSAIDAERALLTIVITDVVESTSHLARLGDSGWRDLLAAHGEAIRREVERYDGRLISTVGDSFVISFDSLPSTATRAALAMVAATKALNIDIRVGMHTGECELIGDDVGGIAVHIASRIGDLAGPGEVLASATTFGTSVGTGIEFEDRGMHELKGLPLPLPVFKVNP